MTASFFQHRYTLQRKLGAGRLGEVFSALEEGDGGFARPVAFKRLSEITRSRAELCRVFLADARVAALLSHPHIVRISDVGIEEDHHYLAMDRVLGCDLRRLAESATQQGRDIPIDVGVGIILQLLEGLRHAHRLRDEEGRLLGLVHRAIRPTNVLISLDGIVQIADFAVARAERQLLRQLDEEPSLAKLSYMAPEALLGEPLDQRSDLFSVGVLLYELTVGQRLVRGEDLASLVDDVGRPIKRPSSFRRDFPSGLEEIILRTLQRDPDDRFSTASQLYEALSGFAFAQRLRSNWLHVGRFASEMLGREKDFAQDLVEANPALPARGDEDVLAVERPTLQLRKRPVEPLVPLPVQDIPAPIDHTVAVTEDLVEGEVDLDPPQAEILLDREDFLEGVGPSQPLAAVSEKTRRARQQKSAEIEVLPANANEPAQLLVKRRSVAKDALEAIDKVEEGGEDELELVDDRPPRDGLGDHTLEIAEDELIPPDEDEVEEILERASPPPPPVPMPNAAEEASEGAGDDEAPEGAEHDEAPEGAEHDEAPEGAEHDEAPEGAEHDEAPEGAEHDEAPEGAGDEDELPAPMQIEESESKRKDSADTTPKISTGDEGAEN